jgi:hypothetical protein
MTIPGVDVLSARVILAEIGPDIKPVSDCGTSLVVGRVMSV